MVELFQKELDKGGLADPCCPAYHNVQGTSPVQLPCNLIDDVCQLCILRRFINNSKLTIVTQE